MIWHLRVSDADATVERATLLGSKNFKQKIASEELKIPAIVGVGGTIIHFVDKKSELHHMWDIDFEPVHQQQMIQPAGIRRIDHVAQMVISIHKCNTSNFLTSTPISSKNTT